MTESKILQNTMALEDNTANFLVFVCRKSDD